MDFFIYGFWHVSSLPGDLVKHVVLKGHYHTLNVITISLSVCEFFGGGYSPCSNLARIIFKPFKYFSFFFVMLSYPPWKVNMDGS